MQGIVSFISRYRCHTYHLNSYIALSGVANRRCTTGTVWYFVPRKNLSATCTPCTHNGTSGSRQTVKGFH